LPNRNPVFPQTPKLPLYKEILQILPKLRKKPVKAKRFWKINALSAFFISFPTISGRIICLDNIYFNPLHSKSGEDIRKPQWLSSTYAPEINSSGIGARCIRK